jgi:xylan 1,4-beta-xylosidase
MLSNSFTLLVVFLSSVIAQTQIGLISVKAFLNEQLGPLEIDRFALGQGGLSEEPMWDNRIAEIRALSPRIIRLFIQEYFNLLPERDQYHFDTLDRSVDTILKTGAKPLMCICFKPKVLFPVVDQDVVEPSDYEQWEKLIFNLVRHYMEKGAGIRYWEVANEPDIGEDGGCPYRFQPDSYCRYYKHTVAAILRADPNALVGGPALANPGSPILPALLDLCSKEEIPLHFVSWHIYSSDPKRIRATIDNVKTLLKKYPTLKPETFLDEWNMNLGFPPSDVRIQPCYVAEVAWQMKEGGLDYSCYYHIRDYHVSFERFAPFMSAKGTAFMTGWWNRMPQFDGLFDFQNNVRPAYFTFKLLSRLTGQRLRLTSDGPAVHGFLSRDKRYSTYEYNLLLWNYSASPAQVEISFENMLANMQAKPVVLDAATSNNDEILRLRPESPFLVRIDQPTFRISFEPYEVRFWSFERRN